MNPNASFTKGLRIHVELIRIQPSRKIGSGIVTLGVMTFTTFFVYYGTGSNLFQYPDPTKTSEAATLALDMK